MNKTMKILMLITALLALLAGCNTMRSGTNKVTNSAGAEFVTATDNVVEVDGRARLVIGAKELLGKVMLDHPKFKRVGNFTRGAITIQNTTNDRYDIEYKVDWEDEQGFPIAQSSAWRFLALTPHRSELISSTGKSPDAFKMTITVRLANN